ncbi:hypothetical protein LTR36_006868 [Oleoguttula mirabilis]|uniref:Uncharacterized protein n=1 Tax=Oleoguttula mirabilis TaxID=1507867 RepID=A0AAV9JBH6_9PEZI|nr:hypothetical protein LTR36_006868 [Oleoguttula mirabilis]
MSHPIEGKGPGSKLATTGVDFTPTIHSDTYDYINPEQFDLTGRAVLITGASKGIGRDTAISFAKAGASFIAIGARSSLDTLKGEIEAAAQRAGKQAPRVLALQLDVSDNANVEQAAKETEAAFGRLDILINNAGFLEPFMKMTDSNPEEWKRSYEVNVFGVYHMTRAFLPLLLKTRNGLKEILNLSSIGALFAMPGGSGYQPGKLAVLRFSEFTNIEYPDVLAYSLHPGGVLTDLAKQMGKEMEHMLIDQPRLAADTVVFLTAERREWLGGRYVSATWDMEELLGKREKIEENDLLKMKLTVGSE